jgi:saccharopine dehydrogenase-like NADP-dependent oxidoreductase
MARIIVLGAGLVGAEIARDLAATHEVTSVDRRSDRLREVFAHTPVKTLVADVGDPAVVTRLVAPFDLVVDAMPGHLGRQTLAAVIAARRPVVDIAFFPEDPFELDAAARAAGVTAIVDFGVAPGLSNLIAGRWQARFAEFERFDCFVGGLPASPEPPFEYRAVFSPTDVIEEYTRPARLVENGQVVVHEALTGVEPIVFDGAGTFEAFNTDGLRTLLRTIGACQMREKTVRYPGHARLMQAFRDAGFFSRQPVDLASGPVVPLELSSRLLFSQWAMRPGEEDLTVMRVAVEGREKGSGPARVTYDLVDRYDREARVTSMARTTGYACTAAVRLLAEGRFERPGICPPEFVGRDEAAFDAVLAHLAERGVQFTVTRTPC